MTEDADVVLIGMGHAVNAVQGCHPQDAPGRQEGRIVRMRWFRPFAAEELAKTLSRLQSGWVIDRDFSLGSPYLSGVLPRRFARPCMRVPNDRLWWALFAAWAGAKFWCRT